MKRFISAIQRRFGITRNEGIVLVSLLSGLLGGTFVKTCSTPETHNVVSVDRIIALLDSIATQQASASTQGPLANLDASHSVRNETDTSTGEFGATRGRSTGTRTKTLSLKVDLNKASIVQLQQIPGIGPATARKIVDMRANRKFSNIDDLLDVKGIGPKKLEKMRPYLVTP